MELAKPEELPKILGHLQPYIHVFLWSSNVWIGCQYFTSGITSAVFFWLYSYIHMSDTKQPLVKSVIVMHACAYDHLMDLIFLRRVTFFNAVQQIVVTCSLGLISDFVPCYALIVVTSLCA